MKKIILLFLLASILLTGFASAAIINTTIIRADMVDWSDAQTNIRGYTRTVFAGGAIIEETLTIKSENAPITFTYYLNSGTQISGTIVKTPTGLFTGNLVTTINGKTSSRPYSRILDIGGGYIGINQKVYFVYCTDGTNWYLSGVERSKVIDNYNILDPDGPLTKYLQGGVYGYVYLDSTSDAYTTIDSPANNPAISINFDSNSMFDLITSTTSIASLKTYTKYTEEHASNPGGQDAFTRIYNAVISTIDAVKSFFQTIGTLSTWMIVIAAFLFAGKAFVGIVVLYTLMNIVWCMRSRTGAASGIDGIWIAFKEFIDNEVKLLDFFMKIILYVKDMIKWW
jgi:hypothetical protein